tara:strand:- start:6023 stop:6562 length:540 start_codon:yes stop_codon:yes gene_type:complete
MPLTKSRKLSKRGFDIQERLNKQYLDVVTVTATTDAETIGDNKVIAQSIEIANASSIPGGSGLIKSITILDEVATGPAVDVIFSSVNTAITQDQGKAVGEDVGDLDSALANVVGYVSIAAGDYTDLHDAKVGTKTNIDLAFSTATASTKLYMHIINRSGGNWVATATTNMKVKIGIQKD